MTKIPLKFLDNDLPAMWNIVTGEYWRLMDNFSAKEYCLALFGKRVASHEMAENNAISYWLSFGDNGDLMASNLFAKRIVFHVFKLVSHKEKIAITLENIDLLPIPIKRTLYKELVSRLPDVQFIIFTNCPFVIQGSANANVVTVGKTAEIEHHRVTNFMEWRIEAILSDIMRLDDNIMTDEYQAYMAQFMTALQNKDRTACENILSEWCNKTPFYPHDYTGKLLHLQMTSIPKKR